VALTLEAEHREMLSCGARGFGPGLGLARHVARVSPLRDDALEPRLLRSDEFWANIGTFANEHAFGLGYPLAR
jgi:hypothetical protein